MTPRRRARLALLLAACLLTGALVPASALAAEVRVFAAASLKDAMDAQAKAFEARSGDRVVVSYAASNALARQIENGATVDVFVSADLDWMDRLDQERFIVTGSRANLLGNTLVLIAPAASLATLKIAPGFALAPALRDDKLAMANPDSVPAGKYGKAALVALGVWPEVASKVARAENVRAALALVSRGEAPYGIVYATDAAADPSVRVVDRFPAGSYPPIVYPAALVASSRSAAARMLLDYLQSPAARPVWEQYGFAVAP